MTSNIDRRIDEARTRISRVDVATAQRLRGEGALFIDTRPEHQREAYGRIPGAIWIERNHIEWRLDPTSDHRDPRAESHAGPIVVFCQEGYASTLAVESLTDLGVADVHDLDGGYAGWAAAGRPIEPPHDIR